MDKRSDSGTQTEAQESIGGAVSDQQASDKRRTRQISQKSNAKVDSKEGESPVNVSSALTSAPKVDDAQNFVTVTEKRKLPWFAGCEYLCKVCGDMFYYNKYLRDHIRKDHCDPDDYLDNYGEFETKAVFMNCLECNKEIKRHYSSVFFHLKREHDGMPIPDYKWKHKMKDYHVNVEVKKRIKSELPASANEVAGGGQTDADAENKAPSQSTTTGSRSGTPTLSRKRRITPNEAAAPADQPTVLLKKIKIDPDQQEIDGIKVNLSPQLLDAVADPSPSSSTSESNNLRSHDDYSYENGHGLLEATPQRPQPMPASASGRSGKAWYLGCEYQCQMCRKLFFELNKLLFHIKNSHNVTAKPYQQRFKKFETKIFFYRCKICNSKVKHNKASITSHLQTQHERMKLSAYEEVFHPDLSKLPQLANGMSSTTTTINGTKMGAGVGNDDGKFKEWSRGTCEFTCQVCHLRTNGSVDFWRHAKNDHDLDIPAYKEAYGNPCTVMNKIVCKICNKVLRFDYGTLFGHAKERHQMELRAFYDQYYRQEVKGSLLKKSPGPTPRRDQGQHGPAANEIPVIPSRRLQFGADKDIKTLAHNWAWKCRYRCKICNKSFYTGVGTQKHINGSHNLMYNEYTAKHGDILIKKVLHSCIICKQRVLHDPCTLQKHMKVRHGSSLVEYYQTFIEPKGLGESSSEQPLAPASSSPVVPTHRNLGPGITLTKTNSSMMNQQQQRPKMTMSNGMRPGSSVLPPPPKLQRRPFPPPPPLQRSPMANKSHHPSGFQRFLTPPDSKDAPHFKWANGCDYVCKICNDYHGNSHNSFLYHVKHTHGIAAAEYRQQFGDVTTIERKHRCRICNSVLKWTGQGITNHLKASHTMTLKVYFESYIANRPLDMDEEQGLTTSTASPLASMMQMAGTRAPAKTVATPAAAAPVDAYLPPLNNNNKDWMNQCLFECTMCQNRFTSKADLKLHLDSEHGTTLDLYTKDFGNPMIEMNLHGCLMCQEMVVNDADDIADHLEKAHAVTVDDYHDRFIANERSVATARKQTLCRDWNQSTAENIVLHKCQLCQQSVDLTQANMETHLKIHSIDLRTYEKRYASELDHVFGSALDDEATGEDDLGLVADDVEGEAEVDPNGDVGLDDDDDFGSVYEDDEVADGEADEVKNENGGEDDITDEAIQGPDDIDDIDIEENVDYMEQEGEPEAAESVA